MNMNLSELINEILSEWAYRVDDGQPNPKNEKHLAELSIVLSEMGLSHIKAELFENITEADKKFTNPILNKEIPYKGAYGTSKTGIVGNLLRLPKDSPGRVAAEKLMPPEGSPERDSAMQDLGSEKDGKSTGGDKEKGKEDEKGKEGGEEASGGEEEKAKAAQAMFDPKADPAMGARLDREKAANDKLAQKDKEDSDAEQSAEVPNEDGKFSEPSDPPPTNDKAVEKDGKVVGTTIETEPGLDDIDSNLLKQRVTEMDKYWADHKADVKKAEGIAREKMGYSEEQAKALKKGTPEKSAYDKEVKKNQQPTYNLCKVSIPNSNLFCNGNKNIPRSEMPQFKGEPVEGSQAWDVLQKAKEKDPTATEAEGEPYFRQMLADKGIKVTDAEVPSENLKATQNELVGDKVLGMESGIAEAMADTMPDGSPKTEEQKVKDEKTKKNLLAPIFVSNDGYVVDGHHRWAAITRYNMEHPDKPIPLKVMIIDQPIDDAIKTSNEFASEFGVAAKSGKQAGPGAGPNAEPPANEPSRPNTNPTEDKSSIQSMKGESKTIKGKKSGKDIQTIEMEGGGMVYGTQHENTAMVDDIIDDIKSKIPQEKWKDIVFVGEGGATNNNGELEFNDEMDYAAPKFKELGAGIDSWDGDDLDVHKEESKLYKKQKEKTGLNDNQIKAGNWASMIGQGEGTDTMQPTKFLDDDGKQFLQDAAKEAGLPPIENWDTPTGEKPSEENGWKGNGDRGTLYRLSFPEDNGDKETKINDIQVAFNETRDENILEKTKELQAKGKIPITIAGEGHIDLVNGMIKNENSQYMNEENLQLADKLMLEIIYGFIAEATYPKADDGKFWVKNKKSGEVYTVATPKAASHSIPTPAQIKKATADGTTQSVKPAVTPTGKKSTVTPTTTKKEPVAGADLFKDKDAKARLDKEKNTNKATTSPNLDKLKASSSYQRGMKALNPAQKKIANELMNDINSFYAETNDKKKTALAKALIEKYKLSGSNNKQKLYVGVFDFNQEAKKMLGVGGAASVILGDLEKASNVKLGGSEASGAKVSALLGDSAKPDLTDKSKAKDDALVADIFKTEPLSYLEGKFYELHGPLGTDGKLIGRAGGENAKVYFQHSVSKNKALDKTIELLKILESQGKVKPGLRKVVEAHKAELQRIASEMTIPSKEASAAVGASYSKVAQSLVENSDKQVANSIMKQWAEMALYDTETAAGDECYLPSAGNFPSGDKIKITRKGTKIEKVASVSVKYGSTGKYGNFGFPGECAQYQNYHPNPEYRDRNNSHPGVNGYSLGIKDNLIDDKKQFMKMLNESGMAKYLKNAKDIEAFHSLMQKAKLAIEKLRQKHKVNSFKDLVPHLKEVKVLNEKFAKDMQKLFNINSFVKEYGKDNSAALLGGPMNLMTGMCFAATLNTSNGLNSIEHNHQLIDDKGIYHSSTDSGSPNLKLWKLSFRAYDERGGGMITSYNSARKDME